MALGDLDSTTFADWASAVSKYTEDIPDICDDFIHPTTIPTTVPSTSPIRTDIPNTTKDPIHSATEVVIIEVVTKEATNGSNKYAMTNVSYGNTNCLVEYYKKFDKLASKLSISLLQKSSCHRINVQENA